jgi:hypothetical protein
LHVAGDFGMQGGSHMAVGVESQRNRAVTEEFLNNLRVNAAIEEMSGCGVPEVMYPDSWQASLIERPMKPFGRQSSINGSSESGREDQGSAIPLGPSRQLVFDLAPTMFR